MMDWPHKESTLWQWLPLSAPNGKQNWLPWCPLTSTQQKGVIFHWPVAKWFPVSLLEALDPQHCWRGCFCENFLFYFCQGHSVLLEPFKWTAFFKFPLFWLQWVWESAPTGAWSEADGALPFLLFHTFTLTSNSALPYCLVFLCFLSYFCFQPQPSFEFYCYMPWFSMFLFLVFLSPCLWLPFVGLQPLQSPLEPVKVHGQCCRCQAAYSSGTG